MTPRFILVAVTTTLLLGAAGYVYAVSPNDMQKKWMQDGAYNEQLVRIESDANALRGSRALYAALYDTAQKWANDANGKAESAAFKVKVDSYDSRVAALSDQWNVVNSKRTDLEASLDKSQGSFIPAQ